MLARRPARPLPGFTLIELLMVIGVIVILIALMIPGLARAKEWARRDTCLSNLRQVHFAFIYYAQDNNDIVPLGYRSNTAQFNSMLYSRTAGRLVLLGLLYKADPTRDWRTLYCPSETNAQSMFNSVINPWPPGVNPVVDNYAGYGCRPAVNVPDDWSTVPAARLPKLSQFKNQAVLSDLTATPTRVDTRHQTGVNVLFDDGHANWVDRALFQAPLAASHAILNAPWPAANYNNEQFQIWNTFDGQR